MPSKQAKQRKQDRKRTNKDLKVGKTYLQRKQRLANKVKRDAIHAIDPDLKVTIINGKSYIGDDVMIEIKVVDGMIEGVPTFNDDIPIDGDPSNAVAVPDYGDDGIYECVHGNDLSSSCSDCFNEQFKEAESYKDDLDPDHLNTAMQHTQLHAEETMPEHKSMWDKLKNKWEKI